MNKPVFNLEFPPYIHEINVGGYIFTRVPDYSSAHDRMQHLVGSYGSEFNTRIQDGSHQVTASVVIPPQEQSCVLPWADEGATALLDVTLLLSIFTGRNVFVDMDEDGGVAILQDHRLHAPFGGELILSLPTIPVCRRKGTITVCNRSALEGEPIWEWDQFDAGFEKGLNDILDHVRTDEWREKYEHGHFLLLYKQAMNRQIIETSFILCWSIWEHLFTLHNRSQMDEKTIVNTKGDVKIDSIYKVYFEEPSTVSSEFVQLKETRNRIVHYGMPVRDEDNKAMERFIRMTERLVAIILGLKQPSYVLEGAERRGELGGEAPS